MAKLDHKYLNDEQPFTKLNPSAENIAKFIFNDIKSKIKAKGYKLSKVTVWESDRTAVSYIP